MRFEVFTTIICGLCSSGVVTPCIIKVGHRRFGRHVSPPSLGQKGGNHQNPITPRIADFLGGRSWMFTSYVDSRGEKTGIRDRLHVQCYVAYVTSQQGRVSEIRRRHSFVRRMYKTTVSQPGRPQTIVLCSFMPQTWITSSIKRKEGMEKRRRRIRRERR